MSLRPLLLVLSAAALTVAVEATPLYSSGPPTGVASNRPDFANCTACHSGIVNSSNAVLQILGMPSVYTPGASYSLTVSLTQSTAMRWGFELTAQDPDGGPAGSFTITDPVNTQLVTGTNAVEYVMHTSAGTNPGTGGGNSWNVDWTAPAAGFGKVVFAASGNAANNNSNNTGDKIVNTSMSAEEDDGSVPLALVAAQPNTIFPQRGTTWPIRARVNSTHTATQTVSVVARIKLPNGSFFPSTGWLFGPTPITLGPGSAGSITMDLPIPASAPLVTATMEVMVGSASAGAMDKDSFVFTVVP